MKVLISLLTFATVLWCGAFSVCANDDMLDRQMSASIASGKLQTIEGVTAELTGGAVSPIEGTNASCWELSKDDSILFSFPLPKDAKDICVTVQCYSSESVNGKGRIRWNGKLLRDEEDKLITLAFDKNQEFKEVFALSEPESNNSFKITAIEGTIGIKGVILGYQVPYPSWDFDDDVKLTLVSPKPGRVFDGSEIEFEWSASGDYANGWIKLEYRSSKNRVWEVIPGAEGFSPASAHWQNGNGNFTWETPPAIQDLEFRIVYEKGPYPGDLDKEREKELQETREKLYLELAKNKWSFLQKAQGCIDVQLWRQHAPEKRDAARKLQGKLEEAFEDVVKSNLDDVVKSLEELDVLIFESLSTILQNTLPREGESSKLREELLAKCDDLVEKWQDHHDKSERLIMKVFADNKSEAERIQAAFFLPEKIEFLRQTVGQIELSSQMEQIANSDICAVAILSCESVVSSVAFSPDGNSVLTTSYDNITRIWDVPLAKIRAQLERDPEYIFQGKHSDEPIRRVQLEGGTSLTDDFPHDGNFSPDGKHVITVSGGAAKIWDTNTGRELKKFTAPIYRDEWGWVQGIRYAVFAPNGKSIFAVGSSWLRAWDILSGAEMLSLESGMPSSFFCDGKSILSIENKTARILDVTSGEVKPKRILDVRMEVIFAAFSQSDEFIVTTGKDKTARIWDVASGKELHKLEHFGEVTAVAFAPNGKIIATAEFLPETDEQMFSTGAIHIWDVATGRELKTYAVSSGKINRIAFSPDGTAFATADNDGHACVLMFRPNDRNRPSQKGNIQRGEMLPIKITSPPNSDPGEIRGTI